MEGLEKKYKKEYYSGKRKAAIARALIKSGDGKVHFNKKDYKMLQFFDKLKMEEPLRIAEQILGKPNYNVAINVRGGGEKGQVEAARLALTRAILQDSKSDELEKAFFDYDRSLPVADVRRKETYKPGDSKARAKRQKSFR